MRGACFGVYIGVGVRNWSGECGEGFSWHFLGMNDDKGSCTAADFGGGAVYGKAW